MKAMLTQSEHSLSDLEPALLARGHEVLRWPLVRTVPLEPAALRSAANELSACRWLLFSSPAAVRAWREVPAEQSAEPGGRAPSGPLIGAVGPGTATALALAGLTPTLIGAGDAVSLAKLFVAHPLAAGPVGLPAGDRALDTLGRRLVACGHQVVTTVVYRTETLPAPLPAESSPGTGAPDVVLLASPSAVSALPARLAASSALVAIGRTTAAAVRATGRDCHVASAPTVEAVLEALLRAAGEKLAARRHHTRPAPEEKGVSR